MRWLILGIMAWAIVAAAIASLFGWWMKRQHRHYPLAGD